MDLREKVKVALTRSLEPDRIELEDDDGISGYVVSEQFRKLSAFDRQTLIDHALRRSKIKLTPSERRRVLAIAALTPAEYAALGANRK